MALIDIDLEERSKRLGMVHGWCWRLALVMLLCCSVKQSCAFENSPRQLNNPQWLKLPTDSLYHLGSYFLNKKNCPDSAFLCYSIIIDRYHENKLKKGEIKLAVVAMHDMGLLYMRFYYDYMKANTYLLMGKDLAIKCNDSIDLSLFSLTLGNLYLTNSVLSPESTDYNAIIGQYKRAFHNAIKVKNWKILQNISINLMNVAFGEDRLLEVDNELEEYNQLEIPDSVLERNFCKALCHGMLLWHKGLQEQAIEVFQALPISDNLPSYNSFELNYIKHEILYHALLKRNDSTAALAHIKELETIAIREGVPEALTDVYRYYYLYHRRQNNLALADKYELLWHRQRDKVIQQTHFNDMKDADFMMQMGKKDEQMRNQRRTLHLIEIFTLFALLMIALLAWLYRRVQKSNRVLYHNNLALLAADEERRRAQQQKAAAKYGNNLLDEDTMDELFERIRQLMETSDEIYKEDFSVNRLAELLGVKQNYVSQAINSKSGKTFTSMLADYRIKEACQRMNDIVNYGHYSIEGIGKSVGYSSRPYFVQLFKKITGLTPSTYQKLARERTTQE